MRDEVRVGVFALKLNHRFQTVSLSRENRLLISYPILYPEAGCDSRTPV